METPTETIASILPPQPFSATANASTPQSPVVVIKLMTFTTDPGFAPNYGDVAADFRGNPNEPGSLFIGSAQGDEHHCVKQWNISADEIPAFLAAAPLINTKLRSIAGNVLVADLEHAIGNLGFVGSIVGEIAAMWPAPTWRIGLWFAHA